jgi:hypothetical protein
MRKFRNIALVIIQSLPPSHTKMSVAQSHLPHHAVNPLFQTLLLYFLLRA